MEITKEMIDKIMPYAGNKSIPFIPYLNKWLNFYGIDNPVEIAAFLAQIGHESGQFRYVKELASGAAYDTGKKAIQLGNTPEPDGDGQRYKGRGLIQITGKTNYKLVSEALCIDCVNYPEMLEQPEWASASAVWYWHKNNLGQYCNPCTYDNFVIITRRINGGTNGLDDRLTLWKSAKEVLV